MNTFTKKLLRLKIEEQGYKNLFFSPLSIEMLLGLILPGTQGKSQEALLEVLEISKEEIRSYLTELQTASESLLGMVNPDEYNPNFTKVQLANSLWHHPNTQVQANYARIMDTRFPFEWFHFSHPAEDTIPRINQWASDKTNGLIPELPITVDEDTVAVLLSALYLKGFWSREFSDIANDTDVFYKLDGTEATSQYMEITQDTDEGEAEAYYLKKENFHALRLMLNDGRIGLEVYLPYEKTGLGDFIDNLQSTDFEQWKKEFVPAPYFYLLMPKFEAEDGFELREIAHQLGLESLFAFSDDLAPMLQSDKSLGFSDIGQQAKIKVTKEGLEAAAVSYMVAVGGAAFYEEPETQEMIIFEADHPFLYRVTDTVTNKTLFQGIFTEPELAGDIFLEQANKRTLEVYKKHSPELSDLERFVMALLLLELTLEKYPLKYDALAKIIDQIWAELATAQEFSNKGVVSDYREYVETMINAAFDNDSVKDSKFYSIAEEINPLFVEVLENFYSMFETGQQIYEYNQKNFGYLIDSVQEANLQLPNYTHLIALVQQHQTGNSVQRIALEKLQFDEIPKTIEYTEEEKQARATLRAEQELNRKLSGIGKKLKAGFALYALTRLRTFMGESSETINKITDKMEAYIQGSGQVPKQEIKHMLYWITNAEPYDTHPNFAAKDRLKLKLLRKKYPDIMAMLAIVGTQFIGESSWDILNEIDWENKEQNILAKANSLLAKHGLAFPPFDNFVEVALAMSAQQKDLVFDYAFFESTEKFINSAKNDLSKL